MLCYKDKTFCPFYKECAKGEGCSRALTQEVIDAACDFNLLISRFLDRPGCFEEIANVARR